MAKEKAFPHIERLVPIELILETSSHKIQLRCSRNQLEEMESFIETEFIRTEIPDYVGDLFMI